MPCGKPYEKVVSEGAPSTAAIPRRILVLGGTTHANRGDLAMQAGLIQWLRREIPGIGLRMLSSNPDTTQAALGIPSLRSPDHHLATEWTRETPASTAQRRRALRRGRWFVMQTRIARWLPKFVSGTAREYAIHLHWADAVFVPGSGSMNSLWWHDWLYPKAFTVLAAAAWKKPVFMTSQGVGPEFSHPLDAAIAGRMFRSCRLVGVRDGESSMKILRSIGVPQDKLVLTGDDALLFHSSAPPVPVPSGRLIGVNLRDSSGYGKKYPKPALDACAHALRQTLDKHPDLHAVFIPISYDPHDDDRKSAAAAAEKIALPERTTVITRELDAAQLRHLVGSMTACLGVSYHFLLFALSSGVPSLGLWQNAYYRQKITGLFDLHKCSADAINPDETEPSEMAKRLAARLEHQLKERDALHQALVQHQEDIEKECAAARMRILKELV